MNFEELINSQSYDEIWKVLDREYECKQGDYEAYRKVFEELKSLEVNPNQLTTTLVIAKIEDGFEPGKFIFDIFGLEEGDENHYAIKMTAWRDWVGFQVLDKSIEWYGSEEVVAHALFEMTFFGYSSDVVAKRVAEEKEILNECHNEIEGGELKSFSSEEIRIELGIVDKRTKEEEKQQLIEFARIQTENEKIYRDLLAID